jgi:protein O-GlcNAc transferase
MNGMSGMSGMSGRLITVALMLARALMLAWALMLAYSALAGAQTRQPDVEAAWGLVAKGQRDQAVALLRQIIGSDPRNADARLLLGSVLMEAGQAAESIDQLSKAVQLRPKSADAHIALGEAYQAFGHPEAARPEFERAVAINPASAQAQLNLAALQLEAGEGDAAAEHLDRAIKLFGKKPDAAYPHYLRAKVYTLRRDTARAATELGQAVALRPDFAEAWSDLGEARKAAFDDAGALAAFRRAVELSPGDAVAQTRLGSKLLDLDKAHEAVPHLQEAARLDPKNQSALNALQLALRKDGQIEQANAVRQRLAELMRERDKADQNLVASIELNNRGAALEKEGDLRGASEKYRAALALNTEHVGIRVNLAVALLKLGQWEQGISEMREALRRDPGSTEIQKALDDAMAQAQAHGIVVRRP